MSQKREVIGIIGGKGEMGRYFADFFERNGFKVIVSDVKTKLNNLQLAKKADVVVVSVPIGVTEKVIAQVAPHVKKGGLLFDLTSLKVFPMEAMKKTKASYLGCHPLFGPTTSIEGQMVVLCKGRGNKWYKWWKELLLKNKVEVKELTAKKHDELMAYIQSLTHFSYLALADALKGSGLQLSELLAYQSPIYRMRLDVMGRILNQDSNLYAQIQIQNPNSLKVMEDLVELSQDWIGMVKGKNVKQFEKRFKSLSDYFGNFKRLAMEESDFLIEQMSRKKLAEGVVLRKTKPDSSYNLVALGPENSFSSLAAKKFAEQISKSQVSSLKSQVKGLRRSPQDSTVRRLRGVTDSLGESFGQMSNVKIWYADSISEVFDIVKKGTVKKGIVPIENNMTGTVVETSDNLFDSGLKIQEEFDLSVHHCLAVLDKIDKKKIKTIYSHTQPIRQCKNYIKKNFPKASVIAMPSTTAALKKVVSENLYDCAVICSVQAAKDFQMTVLAKNIEDYKSNTTRFLVVGKKELPVKKGRKYKTSIAFYFSADAPGTLYQVLGEFAKAKVNMTRIESSANPTVPGGHVFYIDFDGDVTGPDIKKMLSNIKKYTEKVKVLGSY